MMTCLFLGALYMKDISVILEKSRMWYDKEMTGAQWDEREGEHRKQRERRSSCYDLWKWIKQLSEVKGMTLENIQMVNLIYPTQTLTRRTVYQLLLLRAWWDTTAHSHTDTSSFDKCAEVFAPRRLRKKFGWVNNWQYKNDDLWVSQFLAITKFD